MNTFLRISACVAVVALVGCDCGKGQPPKGTGVISVIYDQDGTPITSHDGTYDFGKVGMGQKKTLKFTVRNDGLSPLDLVSVEKEGMGANLKLGETLNEDPPVFDMPFVPQTTLRSGETLELDLTFTAPVESDPAIKTKDHASAFLIRLGNTEEGQDVSHITLKGTAVSGACDLPQTIDFGAVAVQDTVKQGFPITNNSPLLATATIGSITSNSGDKDAFGFAAESATGEVQVQSGATRDVTFTFKPTDVHDYLALVKVRAAEQCPEITIKLIGSGVNTVLSCAPNPLDFGYLTPGLTTQKDLTLTNQGLAPINITNAIAKVGTSTSQEFKVVGPNMFTIPGATRTNGVLTPGTLAVPMSFTPALLGQRLGNLTAATSLMGQSMLSCPLRGQGGGPDIDIKPAVMNFGRIPFFTGSPTPFFASRKVTVQNVGTLPNPYVDSGNLHLGKPGDPTAGFWKVISKNADSDVNDVCIGDYATSCSNTLAAYNTTVGIKATTGVYQDIPIRITPHDKDLNMEFDVQFYSDDPDEPAVTVNVKAQSVVLPPCNYQVTPASLNFGLVTPPQYRDLSFQIKNMGMNAGDECLITHLEMKPGSDGIFSLPAGDLDQVTLSPGQVQNVVVRAWPMGQVTATVQQVLGAVSFGISSPVTPQREVALSASIATSCLTINPSDLDFGTVKKNCSSPRRVFNIYNTCASAVTVQSFGMLAAAGVPGGGSNMYCTLPAGQTCPEFLIDGTPGFMAGSTIPQGASMPVTFALKYKPLDDGPDTGAFLIKVTQNATVVDYIVTLRGVGDNFGLNTDTFRQDSKPKADILLVIDDSGSMSDKQMALAANFSSFIKYADMAGVDYHIGVTVSEIAPGSTTRYGILQGDASNPKVLTPQTPNVQTLFGQKVQVGLVGGFEGFACSAVAALTAPNITGPNAGFLRPDAVLAVVAVTDAGDQCPSASSIYENQLRNIKGAQHANQFSYNVIGPFAGSPTGGCSYDDYTDVSKHLYLVSAFSGVKDEICTPNWASTLENLGKTAFGYRTNFFLTAEPDLTACNGQPMPCSPITVKVDGIVLDARDSRNAPVWDYDSASNAIVFQPLYVPDPGKVLTIEYRVGCF